MTPAHLTRPSNSGMGWVVVTRGRFEPRKRAAIRVERPGHLTTGVGKMRFSARHEITGRSVEFTEETAPDWLTSRNRPPGSTMDNRWFWVGHVLTLEIGQSVDTEFHRITRVA